MNINNQPILGHAAFHPDKADGLARTLRVCAEARARMSTLPYSSPERRRLWERAMKTVYGGADNWRELHEQKMRELPDPETPLPAKLLRKIAERQKAKRTKILKLRRVK